jgi:hypothetical protein
MVFQVKFPIDRTGAAETAFFYFNTLAFVQDAITDLFRAINETGAGFANAFF